MNKEKIAETIDNYNEIANKVRRIIQDTFDSHLVSINSMEVVGDEISTFYNGSYRGCADVNWVDVPLKWLEDGFDYRTAFEKMMEEKRAEAKKAFEEEKRAAAEKKEKEEREMYEKLKNKYEAK